MVDGTYGKNCESKMQIPAKSSGLTREGALTSENSETNGILSQTAYRPPPHFSHCSEEANRV